MDNKKDVAIGLGIGLGVGLIVGGVLGILFAPQKGSDTRKQIRDESGKFIAKVKDVPARVRARMGKSTVDDLKHK